MGIVASGSGVGCVFRVRKLWLELTNLKYSGLAFSYLLQAAIDAYGYHWALRISAFVTTAVIGIALCLMHIAPNSHKRAKAGSFRDNLIIFKTEKWLIACVFFQNFAKQTCTNPNFTGIMYPSLYSASHSTWRVFICRRTSKRSLAPPPAKARPSLPS